MPQPYNPQLELENGRVDWLNVKALGARGDGIADDAPIFTAAGLLAAQPPGQLIYIPAGTYRLGSNVVFAGGVQYLNMGTLTGSGVLSGGSQVSFGAGSLVNPMTSTGDIIYGAGAGVPTRLPIGLAAQVLTVAAGLPSWQPSAAGFANPMSTPGDLITGGGGGAAQRLAAGLSGQVLGIAAGAPAWVNNPAGFANPMSAKGDLILAGTGGVAARLPVGSSSQILQVVAGTAAWQTLPTIALQPTGDTTGALDLAAINAAITALTPGGGVIVLGSGQFYVSGQITLPAQTTAGTAGGGPVSLRGQGPATVINAVAGHSYSSGSGPGVLNYHRTSGYGAQFNQPAQKTIGYIRDLVIDGTSAQAGTTGLDAGDGWGLRVLDVTVANFSGAGSIGLQIVNRVFWSEKQEYRMNLLNNTTACYMTTAVPGSDHSHEYNVYDFYIFCNQNQQGVVNDGVNQGGSILYLHGNMCQTTAVSGPPTGNVAALSLINTTGQNNGESRWYSGQVWIKVEFNNSAQYAVGIAPYCIYSDGVARGMQQCGGFIAGSNLSASNLNGCEFSFFGGLAGDPNLSQAFPGAPGSQNTITGNPAVPATGVAQQNYGPNAQVFVTGGTVSGVSISGIPTGMTSGAFYVAAGASITLNYSVAPAWTWVPAAQMSF